MKRFYKSNTDERVYLVIWTADVAGNLLERYIERIQHLLQLQKEN